MSLLLPLAAGAGLAHAQTVPCNCQTGATPSTGDSGGITLDGSSIGADSTSVAPRKRKAKADPYGAYGYDDGAFRFRPMLEIGVAASSNANLSPTAPKADVGLRLKPSFAFESDWPRHAWKGSASLDLVNFASTPSANSTTGTAETSFRLDIRHTTHADFSTTASLTQANAGSSEVPGTAIGPRQDVNFAQTASITHDFGGFEGRFKTGLARASFGDVALSGGGTEINADRNYWEPSLSARATLGHEGLPLRPFAEVSYDPRFHDQTVDRNGEQRNSQGFGAALGLDFADGPIWSGEIAGNFIARSFDDPALQTATALGVSGTVTWSPTPLWSIVANSGVALNESEVAGVSATQSWNAGLNATYAWRDNVNFRGGGTLTLADNGSSIDTTVVASLGADWQLNPNMALAGTVQNTWYAPGSGVGAYSEQRAITSIVLRP
ncbi:MAG: outer membrane beta-barrel protein [Alphaproteobacteria bacterium]|nr:outer membrane beta-barrel protein [Alphaproteobacteria bacterium]